MPQTVKKFPKNRSIDPSFRSGADAVLNTVAGLVLSRTVYSLLLCNPQHWRIFFSYFKKPYEWYNFNLFQTSFTVVLSLRLTILSHQRERYVLLICVLEIFFRWSMNLVNSVDRMTSFQTAVRVTSLHCPGDAIPLSGWRHSKRLWRSQEIVRHFDC